MTQIAPALTESTPAGDEGEVLVRVQGVSKRFCRSLKKSLWYGVQDIASELVGRNYEHELRPDEFWAVKDVSFELRRGECLGLIGRNGAGKTTLLRMLNGLIKPDKGCIEMNGRVGALIALGAGFNPILTGRENIQVNASVLSLTKKEIDEKIDEIIDFAEIDDFIDSPVQSYSSGMQVRLGFAVSTALNPDILLLDEVLAVGDTAFRYKCYKRMDSLRENSAMIFVSHDMPNISRICNYSLVMERGVPYFQGDAVSGIQAYETLNYNQTGSRSSDKALNFPLQDLTLRRCTSVMGTGESFDFDIELLSVEGIESVNLMLNFRDISGSYAASMVENSSEKGLSLKSGHNLWKIAIESIPLKPGKYWLGIGFYDSFSRRLLAAWNNAHEITIEGKAFASVSQCVLTLKSWECQD